MINCFVFVDGFFVVKIFFVGGIYFGGFEFLEFFDWFSKFVVNDFFVFMFLFFGL